MVGAPLGRMRGLRRVVGRGGLFSLRLTFFECLHVPGSILYTVHTVPLSNICLLEAEEIN